jgi:hypothetical protein
MAALRPGEMVHMSDPQETPAPDPIDVEMAHIDARDPEAAEKIEHVEEDAEALGREDADNRPSGAGQAPAEMAPNAELVLPTDADPEATGAEMRAHPAAQPPDRSHA